MERDDDQLIDFARRYTAAWCSQEPANVAEHYSADGSLTINDGEPSVGRAAIAEAARSFMTAFPDLRVVMDDLRTEERRHRVPLDADRNQLGARWHREPGPDQRLRAVDDR